MARKSHKKRKGKRTNKKLRNEQNGSIARRKRERKKSSGLPPFINLAPSIIDPPGLSHRAILTEQFD